MGTVAAPSALASGTDTWTHWAASGTSNGGNNDEAWVYALDFTSPTNLVAATNGNGIFQSPSVAGPWKQEVGGLAPDDNNVEDYDTYDVINSGNTLYAATSDGVFSASAGSTLSWSHLGDGLGANKLNFGASTEAILAESSSDLIVGLSTGAGQSGIYTSSDGGSTWKPATSMPASEYVYSLAQGAGSIVYAAGSTGVWTSFDGGASWNLTSNGLDTADQFFRVYTGTEPNEVWASTGSHLYHSTNAGASWTIADGTGPASLPASKKWGVIDQPSLTSSSCPTTATASDPFPCNDVFVGTNDGVYLSPDDGTTWGQMSPDSVQSSSGGTTSEGTGKFGTRIVFSLALGFSNTLLAGTEGFGTYSLPLTPVTSSSTATESPTTNLVPGNTMTATSKWAGTLPFFITYQWKRCVSGNCTSIKGATSSSYIIPTTDAAPAGVSYEVTSCSTNVLQPVPVCTTSVKSGTVGAIPGTEPVPITDGNSADDSSISGGSGGSDPWGTTYTINPGEWGTENASGVKITPTSYAYQWQRCDDSGNCSVIPGATGASYTSTKIDVGDGISGYVQATSSGGSSAFYLAGQIDTVIEKTPVDDGTNGTVLPTIDGSAYVGEALQAYDGLWSADDPTYTQYWERCDNTGQDCEPIYDSMGDLEDGSTYTVTNDDLGSEIELAVEADQYDPSQDRIGDSNSAPTAVVTDPPPGTVLTTAPTPSPTAPTTPPTGPPTTAPTPTTTTTTPTPTPITTAPAPMPKAPLLGVLKLAVRAGVARVEFKLTGAGSVIVKLEHLTVGHKSGKRCLSGTRARAKRCTITTVVYTVIKKVSKTSTVTITLPTRVRGRKLPHGDYKVVATPVSTRGLHGKARTLALVLR